MAHYSLVLLAKESQRGYKTPAMTRLFDRTPTRHPSCPSLVRPWPLSLAAGMAQCLPLGLQQTCVMRKARLTRSYQTPCQTHPCLSRFFLLSSLIAARYINQHETKFGALFRSIYRTARFHVGTAAIGSLIIAIVQMIRIIFE